MGQTTEEKDILVKFTRSDAKQLIDVLNRLKGPITKVTNDLSKSPYAVFLTQVTEGIQKAMA